MIIEEEIEELKNRITVLENLLLKKEIKNECLEPTTLSKRDKTRYMFDNKVYAKNRLVLAIISSYVKDSKPTFSQLQSVFDKSLQGSLNVVEKLEEAEKITDCAKRYFVKPNEQIFLKDGTTCVICTQWGIFNIVKFLKLAENLGFKIESI